MNANFYLYNFYINRNIFKENTFINQDEYTNIQLSYNSINVVQAKKPILDENGQPIKYLNQIHSSEVIPVTEKRISIIQE